MARWTWRQEMGRGFAFGLGFSLAALLIVILLAWVFFADRHLNQGRVIESDQFSREQFDVRSVAAQARSSLRTIGPAIYDFLETQGRAPDSLQDIVYHHGVTPDQISDPFNPGSNLHYEYAEGSWLIASVGPDGRLTLPAGRFDGGIVDGARRYGDMFNRETGESVLYDPTNGVRSAGDILIIDHRRRYRRDRETGLIGTFGPIPFLSR